MNINHTAIAVHDLDEAISRYAKLFGFAELDRMVIAEQGVTAAFLGGGIGSLELIAPLDDASPLHRFLTTRGESLHHVAVEVADIVAELDRLRADDVQLIDDAPKHGAHGLVAFIHPRGTGGVLWELVEVDRHS